MMKKKDSIRAHDEHAAKYDRQAHEYGYFPEALFGLSFEYVSPHDRLLDIGIGTGLASLPFAKVGLEIFGIDGSREMLEVCKSKDFAKDLKHFDLKNTPLPYSNAFFDHVVSYGVFHLFSDLEPIFKEVSRIIKPGGIFVFTIMMQASLTKGKAAGRNREDYLETSREGVPVFMHSSRYIEKLLRGCGFDKLKQFKFLLLSGKESIDDLFCAYVAQKSGT